MCDVTLKCTTVKLVRDLEMFKEGRGKGDMKYGSVLWVWNLNIGLLLLLGLSMSHVECYFEIRFLAVFLFNILGVYSSSEG